MCEIQWWMVELDDRDLLVCYYCQTWQCILLLNATISYKVRSCIYCLNDFFVCYESHIILAVLLNCLNYAYLQSLLMVYGFLVLGASGRWRNMYEFSAVALSCLVGVCRMWVFSFESFFVYLCSAYQCLKGFSFHRQSNFMLCFLLFWTEFFLDLFWCWLKCGFLVFICLFGLFAHCRWNLAVENSW